MSPPSSPVIHAVVLGGNGAVGALFASVLAEAGVAVTAIDVFTPAAQRPGVSFIRSDAADLSDEARRTVAAADWVVVALPEAVTLAAWESVTGLQPPDALFVDTLSVKLPLIGAMAGRINPSLEVISINPMFAPSLGFKGQSVAVVEVRRGRHAERFLQLLEDQGAALRFLDAELHDRYAPITQAATHAAILAFGLALRRLEYDLPAVRPIMPPPHRALLALLARVLSASPEVYRDIQSVNPHAPAARQALADGLRELEQVVESRDPVRFQRLFADLQEMFGGEARAEFARLCARMFTVGGA